MYEHDDNACCCWGHLDIDTNKKKTIMVHLPTDNQNELESK